MSQSTSILYTAIPGMLRSGLLGGMRVPYKSTQLSTSPKLTMPMPPYAHQRTHMTTMCLITFVQRTTNMRAIYLCVFFL